MYFMSEVGSDEDLLCNSIYLLSPLNSTIKLYNCFTYIARLSTPQQFDCSHNNMYPSKLFINPDI